MTEKDKKETTREEAKTQDPEGIKKPSFDEKSKTMEYEHEGQYYQYKKGGRWITTVAGVALILSLVCFIYILKYLPAVSENFDYFTEKVVEIEKRLDNIEKDITILETKIGGGAYNAEVQNLKQSIVVLEDVIKRSNGKAELQATTVKTEMERLIEQLQEKAPKDKE